MPYECVTVEEQQLVEGTGGFFPAQTENWNALAFSNATPVDPYGSWRYAFDPVQGSVFYTGVFDNSEHANPRPNRYILAVEFRINEYRVHHPGGVSGWLAWSPDERLTMQSESGFFRVFKDGTEVWSG